MKRVIRIAIVCIAASCTISAMGAIRIPNTDIEINEIVTSSTPQALIKAANAEGTWKKDEIGWWWEYPDGTFAKNTWEYIENHWYYFNHDGYMYVGWRYINNNWYYLNPGDISELPFGAMATGWQSIHSANYGKSFDYYLGPDGNLLDSPSERFISYGHDYTLDGDVKEINTMARAEEVADILTNLYGLKGDLRTNKVASDVFNIDGNIPDGKTYLNTGLFVHNGNGGQGCAIFRSHTALSGRLTGVDANDYSCTKIEGNDMNNCKIALFFSCSTGVPGTDENGNPGKGDLLSICQDAGVLGVFGFTNPVLHDSDNVFGPALVRELGRGATLTEAAVVAQESVPLYDACRNYRILGGDTKFIISNEDQKTNTSMEFLDEDMYMLYDSKYGYDSFVKVIDGIMTSDYYVTNARGDVIFSRNKIMKDSVDSIVSSINSMENIKKYSINKDFEDGFDVYEKIDGETRLLRIVYSETINNDIVTLEAFVTDLQTGESIPYSKILESY